MKEVEESLSNLPINIRKPILHAFQLLKEELLSSRSKSKSELAQKPYTGFEKLEEALAKVPENIRGPLIEAFQALREELLKRLGVREQGSGDSGR